MNVYRVRLCIKSLINFVTERNVYASIRMQFEIELLFSTQRESPHKSQGVGASCSSCKLITITITRDNDNNKYYYQEKATKVTREESNVLRAR